MKITVKELTTSGPTIHSSFIGLPYLRESVIDKRLPKPVLAYQTSSCIKIVGNIHNFIEAQESAKTSVPVYLIEDSESTLELLELIIEYYQPMTLMDKALLTRAALDLGVPRQTLSEKIYPQMDLAPRQKLIDQLLFLLKLPTELKTFIVDKDLSLKRAIIFQRAEEHLEWVSRFISNMKIGINMTAEIIQNIWEMAQRDDVDFKTKAIQMGLWEMADADYEDIRLAVADIRERINSARYPTLGRAGIDLSKTIETAQLPDSVSVKWDP
ncbi:hypothetical protein HQ531_10605 [bacterium]|nr:hypothetical protein [bacterium]